MGFDVQGIKFLLGAHRGGVSFLKTATIGRQEFFIPPVYLGRILNQFGVGDGDREARRMLTESRGFSDPLLRFLGAEHIVSVDASSYEGASVVHDMNSPIPESLSNAFSVVIDGGTLEHVFNFPVAITNCMKMVQVGGHLLLMTPANNFMGHGFYQFSPELFFRIFSQENGFEISRAVFSETSPRARWYEIVDPARARRRVELVNSRPAYLLIQARKLRQVPVLAIAPQQSDYTVLWEQGVQERSEFSAIEHRSPPARVARGLLNRFAHAFQRARRLALTLLTPRPDAEVFKQVNWLP